LDDKEIQKSGIDFKLRHREKHLELLVFWALIMLSEPDEYHHIKKAFYTFNQSIAESKCSTKAIRRQARCLLLKCI